MAEIHRLQSDEQLREQACEWIGRLQAHNVSREDRARFEAWRAAHPRHAEAYAQVDTVWRGMVKVGELVRAVGVGQEFNAITERAIHRTRADRARGRTLLFSAAAVLVVALGAGWWINGTTEDTLFRTAIGERATVNLPDGSTLELNSNSQARVSYDAGRRVVKLERGEAFFDVHPDPGRPFWVAAGRAWVGAVGTAFNVDMRVAELRVTVSEGAVKVAPDAQGRAPPVAQAAALPAPAVQAGQQLAVRGEMTEVRSLEPAQLSRSLAWRAGFVVFKEERLEDVVKELSRYTRLRIVIQDERLRELNIGGTFETNDEGAEALLANLKDGFGLQVRRDNRTVYIQ